MRDQIFYWKILRKRSEPPKKNKERRWEGEWVFSIYNLYNRKNTQSLNFRENQDTGRNEAIQLSLFGAIASVSYNFKF